MYYILSNLVHGYVTRIHYWNVPLFCTSTILSNLNQCINITIQLTQSFKNNNILLVCYSTMSTTEDAMYNCVVFRVEQLCTT